MSHEVSYDYVEQVDPNLSCAICQSALVDPVTTTSCKHTFCRDCITRAISHNPQCPIDRSALTMGSLRDTEQLVKLMLDELKVRCCADGCGMVLQRGLLLSHLRTCTQAVVTCQDGDCGLSMNRQRLPHHRAYECFQRKMECKRCGTILIFTDQTAHTNDGCCDEGADACDLCGETLGIDAHMHKWRCPQVRIPCPHSSRGCSSIIPRTSVDAHLATCPFEAFSGFFEMNDARLKVLENRAHDMESELDSLRSHLRRVEGNVDASGRAGHGLGQAGWLWTTGGRPTDVVSVPEAGSDQSEPLPSHIPLPPSPLTPVPTPRPLLSPSSSPPSGRRESPPNLNTTPPARQDLAHHHHRSLIAPSFGSHQSYADWAFNRLSGNGSGGWEDVINRLRGVVVQLAAGLDSMERRNEVRTMTESLRVLEEVNSLRAIVTTMRTQVMMDRPPRPSPFSFQSDHPFSRPTEHIPRSPLFTEHTTSSSVHSPTSYPHLQHEPDGDRNTAENGQDDLAETASITESVVFSAQGHSASAPTSSSSLVITTGSVSAKRSGSRRNSQLNPGGNLNNGTSASNSTVGRSGAGLTGRPVAFPEAIVGLSGTVGGHAVTSRNVGVAGSRAAAVDERERSESDHQTLGRSGSRLSRNPINRLMMRRGPGAGSWSGSGGGPRL